MTFTIGTNTQIAPVCPVYHSAGYAVAQDDFRFGEVDMLDHFNCDPTNVQEPGTLEWTLHTMSVPF